jgi:hypothetical protein
MAKTLSALPPATVDGVDRMYHQLTEIHAIAPTQLAEGARWCRSDPASSLVRAGTDR